MVEETTPRRRQAFADENLYLEPVLAPVLRRVEVPPASRLSEGVTVTLERAQLWKAFYSRTNEMIVTRKGRKMFPTIRLRVSGLEKTCLYAMCLEFVQVHDIKFRYIHGDWKQTATARADPPLTAVYVHPKSYQMGAFWMSEAICFDDVKITNDKTAGPSMMPLNSMHMYEPRLHIVRVNVIPGQGLEAVGVMTHRLRVTGFVAVTAYQNDKVTALKVENNPFARAFNRSASALAAFELSLAQAGQLLAASQQTEPQPQHSQSKGRFQPYPRVAQSHSPCGQRKPSPRSRGPSTSRAQVHNGGQPLCSPMYPATSLPVLVSGSPQYPAPVSSTPAMTLPASCGTPGVDYAGPLPYPACSGAAVLPQASPAAHAQFPQSSPQMGAAGGAAPPLVSPPFTQSAAPGSHPGLHHRVFSPDFQQGAPQPGAPLPPDVMSAYQYQYPEYAQYQCGYRAAVGTPSPASSCSGGAAAGWTDTSAAPGGGGGGNYWSGGSPPGAWGGAGCEDPRLGGGIKNEPAYLLTPPHGSPASCSAHRHEQPGVHRQSWQCGAGAPSPHVSPQAAGRPDQNPPGAAAHTWQSLVPSSRGSPVDVSRQGWLSAGPGAGPVPVAGPVPGAVSVPAGWSGCDVTALAPPHDCSGNQLATTLSYFNQSTAEMVADGGQIHQ